MKIVFQYHFCDKVQEMFPYFLNQEFGVTFLHKRVREGILAMPIDRSGFMQNDGHSEPAPLPHGQAWDSQGAGNSLRYRVIRNNFKNVSKINY